MKCSGAEKGSVEKLQKKGFEIEGIADALGLDKENWLKRRFQTVVHKKGLTNTAKQARQLIAHKHVSIGNQIVNKPSYQVSLEEEQLVKLNLSLKLKEPKKSKVEEIKGEILEERKINENSMETKVSLTSPSSLDSKENKEVKENIEEKK